jgi:hypothetical protein
MTSYHPLNKKNIKLYKVFFFNTPLCLEIPINQEKKVSEIVAEIIEYCYSEPKFDKEHIRWPNNSEAYQICQLDDEDDYIPDFSIPPLEDERIFSTYGIAKGVVKF